VTAQSVSLADSYISGRAPEFTFFNFGFERVVTKRHDARGELRRG